jgi:TatD DNase family protein
MLAPIRLVDSHAHLDMEEFDPDRDDVVRRAFEAGLDHLLCPLDISSERSIRITQDLTAAFARIHAAAGLHPHQAGLFTPNLIAAVRGLAERKKILAIGEIGLDFHYDFATPHEQKDAFRGQLALARELGLPVIIHSRNAGLEIALAIREEGFSNGGILHCFTEDWDFAKTALDAGFYISFSGLVTFPKSQDLREVARKVPADRLLVETDAPYLAPVPHRGKRNEPAFVVETAKLMAQIRKTSFEKISEEILGNFRSLFHIDS